MQATEEVEAPNETTVWEWQPTQLLNANQPRPPVSEQLTLGIPPAVEEPESSGIWSSHLVLYHLTTSIASATVSDDPPRREPQLWHNLPTARYTRQPMFLFDAKEDTAEHITSMKKRLTLLLFPIQQTTCHVAVYVAIQLPEQIISAVESIPSANYPDADADLNRILQDLTALPSSASQVLKRLLLAANSGYCIGRSLTPRRMTESWRDAMDGFKELGVLGRTGNIAVPHAQFCPEHTQVLRSQGLPVTTKLSVVSVHPAALDTSPAPAATISRPLTSHSNSTPQVTHPTRTLLPTASQPMTVI